MKSFTVLRPAPNHAAKPSVRERAASLKASVARLMGRTADNASADQGRRLMVAGSVAAVVAAPLPVLASAAMPVAAGPHPDQALFDAEADYLRAVDAEKAAAAAISEAHADFWEALGPCPDSLLVRERQYGLISWPGGPFWNRGVRLQWVKTTAPSDDPWGRAWTVKGLERAIALAPQALGRGGRTPHLIREWRALLPVAAAFEAQRSAMEERFNTERLSRAEWEARTARNAANLRLSGMPASTLKGLAARHGT